jgi:hypothetical protein
MIIRQITIDTQPPQIYELFYQSRSNAEKPFEDDTSRLSAVTLEDDFKQRVSIPTIHLNRIVSDRIIDQAEALRAQGELQIIRLLGETKFEDRIDKDPLIKAAANKKRAQQIMANAQRVPAPPGIQT